MANSTKESAGGSGKPVKKARQKKTAPAKAASPAKGPAPGKAKSRTKAPPRRREPPKPEPAAATPVGLTEEEAIRSAKYLPRDMPPRLFEEERFIFPKSYGVNRIRLLIKDPEWLFVHWDLRPATLDALKREVGERAFSLSRLTLRISDPINGGSSDILLAPDVRSWYVRTDDSPRSYKAELGMTLPSGGFRRMAESNVVAAPRVGPSPEQVKRVMSYRQAKEMPAEAVRAATRPGGAKTTAPWKAPSVDATRSGPAASAAPGGASDVFRK